MVNVELKQGDCLELMKDIPDGSVDIVMNLIINALNAVVLIFNSCVV